VIPRFSISSWHTRFARVEDASTKDRTELPSVNVGGASARRPSWRGIAGWTIGSRRRLPHSLLLAFVASFAHSLVAEELKVPIHLNKPDRLQARSWPVTFGVPFKRGEFRDVSQFTVVDASGKPVPCEIIKTGDWEDGSLRWATVDFNARLDGSYFLVRGARAEAKDDIALQETADTIAVETGGARYQFRRGAGCFESVHLDANADGKFAVDELFVSKAGDAFYVVDSKGQRSILHAKSLKIEHPGKRHAVIRIEGDYVFLPGVTAITPERNAVRTAAGVVYYHFYAGRPWVRISHKLIVTENTNELWFRDIGIDLPVALEGPATVSFNKLHRDHHATVSQKLSRSGRAWMAQKDFPHFGSRNSIADIGFSDSKANLQAEKLTNIAGACGDWADVSTKRWGLGAQVPGFAEQFPKAYRISGGVLTIKLWDDAAGKELDFRTPQIIQNYFGHDWIPENDPCMKVPNAAQGTAKTHEIWLYPHRGPLTKELAGSFGATREEIYAAVDPAWVARSEVLGPIHPKDEKRFPREEAVISDYFDRSVLAGDRIFPATGYLYWGMYPYSAQPWELKNGRWYPTIHRLARSLEYNLKRGMWILYARSGERKYFDYARRYTRLCGNLLFSNSDSPAKPAGWMVQGNFHSPIVWGQFGGTDTNKDFKHKMDGGAMCIAFASSEDVIQFVYDYFLTGDLHSRDMALLWKEAMIKEMNFDVDKALQFYPPEAFLRVLGSGYELDHDPRLLDYGSRIVKRRVLCDGKHILNPDVPTNFGKEGEVFSAYYYYHVATGDPLARKALVELAKFHYRHASLENFFSRSSPLQEAFVFAWRETGDATYADHAAQAAKHYAENYPTLKEQGIDFDKLSPATTNDWGHVTMTGQGPIHVGIPCALRVIAERGEPASHLPVAIKPHPTQRTHVLLKKAKPGAASMDVFVNNWGDRAIEPRLLDAQGKPVKLDVVERVYDRIDRPDCYNAHSIWYMSYEDQLFYKLRIPESVPPGVYELDLGDEIDFAIMRSDIDAIVQVAPKGIVLSAGRRYYFPLPQGTEAVEYFASRPVRLFDPEGKEVASEQIKDARFRFATNGKTGVWSMEGGSDALMRTKKASVEAFVKIEKVDRGGGSDTTYPLILALGDPKRLFEIDPRTYAASPALENGKADPERPYVDSRPGFGNAARLASRFVEMPRPADSPGEPFPHRRGTVEFWFRPGWSASDCHLIGSPFGSAIRVELYKAAPISLAYFIDPDNGGRTTRYNTAFLAASLEGMGNTRCRVFLEAGKWYHVALTWNLDGQNNDAHIFLNGRRKAFTHYDNTLPAKKDPSELKPPGQTIRFGSAHLHGRIPTFEDFDELRISRTVRYVTDFEPPAAPFAMDSDTYLLMHLDGTEEALVNNQPAAGKWIRANRM